MGGADDADRGLAGRGDADLHRQRSGTERASEPVEAGRRGRAHEVAGTVEQEPVEETTVASEPAGAEGLPGWALGIIALLVVLVLGLGGLVAVVFKRTTGTSIGS